jgi:hypothetical protein
MLGICSIKEPKASASYTSSTLSTSAPKKVVKKSAEPKPKPFIKDCNSALPLAFLSVVVIFACNSNC